MLEMVLSLAGPGDCAARVWSEAEECCEPMCCANWEKMDAGATARAAHAQPGDHSPERSWLCLLPTRQTVVSWVVPHLV